GLSPPPAAKARPGSIASSSGRPIATPRPRRTALREIPRSLILHLPVPTVPEGVALDDLDDQAREAVSVLLDRLDDLPDARGIVVVDLPPERVGHQVLGQAAHEVALVLREDERLELRGTTERRP